LLSKDYPAELKQGFTDWYAKGTSTMMLRYEFGPSKSTVKVRRGRIDRDGVKTIGRPRKSNRCAQELRVEVVEAFLAGEAQ